MTNNTNLGAISSKFPNNDEGYRTGPYPMVFVRVPPCRVWYDPQFLDEKSAIIAREPKFDMILNWKKSAAKCAKFHEVGVTYWGNEFTIFLD